MGVSTIFKKNCIFLVNLQFISLFRVFLNMLKYILLLLFSILVLTAFSQIKDKCGTGEYYVKQKQSDPTLEAKRDAMENYIRSWIKYNKANKSGQSVITIPVVFHILWDTITHNVSNAQVYSQLDVLNEDYRRMNYDAVNTPAFFHPVAVDCHIEFCLAQRTPDGKPANGIIRKHTSVKGFSADLDNVKYSAQGGDDIWDRNMYLNVWVCNLETAESSEIAGYSSYPGYAAEIDGIVVNYKVFGRTGNHDPMYNLGRTVTHEVGHWLGLYHTWGPDPFDNCGDNDNCNCSDGCSDTPTQAAANYFCPHYPHPSCNSDSSDAFMDYMDYSPDSCMNMFTRCQNMRMLAILNDTNPGHGGRASILTSNGCSPLTLPPTIDFTANYTKIPATKSINFSATTNDNFTHYLWIFNGGSPDTSNFQQPQNITYNKMGKYTVTLIATNSLGTARATKYNFIEVDTLGKNGDVKIDYNYFKNHQLNYYYKYDTLGIYFGKHVFYNVNINIYNVIGRLMASYSPSNDQFFSNTWKIALPLTLNNGIYIIQIQTQNGFIRKKIMLMR